MKDMKSHTAGQGTALLLACETQPERINMGWGKLGMQAHWAVQRWNGVPYTQLWSLRVPMVHGKREPFLSPLSSQSILKEIRPGCSLEGLMLKLKLQYFGHLMRRVDSLEKTLMLGGIGGRRRRG